MILLIIIPNIHILEWELLGQMRPRSGKVIIQLSLIVIYMQISKFLISKCKLNHAICSSKVYFCKYSSTPGRHGDSDAPEFKKLDHLFLVFGYWSMPDLKRQMLVCPVVAIYPTTACCLCVLSLLHEVLITRTHECYQANNMNYIYTITIMLIFTSQVV